MEHANELNEHLSNNGVVIVAAYGKATQYEIEHAGMFFTGTDGNLYVKSGKGSNCLSLGKQLLVSIKLYTYK